ncbi:hypothetical protein CTAYLR_004274 [Chrysophaeum taylorii]|uniref:SAP domain-containing protein n=1 Tax=Chrysophaeum taylorii TaxID=2483200 RepID=A0AAD7UDN6_9STRA|nr:hypothetical protein CTAYLR_004274 [Chrysophaeum taylorii]
MKWWWVFVVAVSQALTTDGFERALRSMTVAQLKSHLRRRHLKTSGRKAELIARALEHREPPKPPGPRPLAEPRIDALLRDTVDLDGTEVYVSSTRSTWKPPSSDRSTCGVVVRAPVVDAALQQFADSIAAVCNAVVVATPIGGGEKALEWLRTDRRAESIGIVAFGDLPTKNDDASFDASVLWRPTQEAAQRAAKAPHPVLALFAPDKTDDALLLAQALAKGVCPDYLVRVISLAADPAHDLPLADDDEPLLLCTAWLDLHLGRRWNAKTAGDPVSQLWIDDAAPS